MKQKTAGVFLIAALCAVLTAGAVMLRQPAREAEAQAAVPEKTRIASPVGDDLPEETYIIREYKGEICIFTGRASEPAVFTGIETAGLPGADREALQKGIAVAGYEEVVALLEDFGS